MVNQGGYEWRFEESKDKTQLIFHLQVPRFMDTSSLNVDVQPTYIRCEIKDKVTQLHWPEEVLVDDCKIQRSQTTGALCVTCRKMEADLIQAKQERHKTWQE